MDIAKPHFQLDFEASISFDHSPGVLSIPLGNKFDPKPFKFIKGWMKHLKVKVLLF